MPFFVKIRKLSKVKKKYNVPKLNEHVVASYINQLTFEPYNIFRAGKKYAFYIDNIIIVYD